MHIHKLMCMTETWLYVWTGVYDRNMTYGLVCMAGTWLYVWTGKYIHCEE